MVNINLLPRRKFEREYQISILKKVFVLTIFLALLMIMIAHLFVAHQETSLQARIATVNAKITAYREKNPQNISRINITPVDNKQKQPDQNMLALHLFSELGKKYQEKVCFTDIERLGKTFSFSGKTRSMTELTEFLRHWNAAYLFNEIEIKSIEEQENGFVQFRFQAVA